MKGAREDAGGDESRMLGGDDEEREMEERRGQAPAATEADSEPEWLHP